jgi:hypothetical protein
MTTQTVKFPFNPRTLSTVIEAKEECLTVATTKYGEVIRVDDRGDHFYLTVQNEREALYSGKHLKKTLVKDVLGVDISIKWVAKR